MSEDEKTHSIAVPGEWAFRKMLGPTLDAFGEDLAKAYAAGRDRILAAATRKTPNLEDGGRTNLRITADVFRSGSFTDDEICAEYFGGVLASSRSHDGKDDSAIFYLEIIKSLSSSQLKLHYYIYHTLNILLSSDPAKAGVNMGQSAESQQQKIFLSTVELSLLGVSVDRDFEVLFRQGLISEYQAQATPLAVAKMLPYCMAGATTLGVHLYAVAFNRLQDWRQITLNTFGDMKDVKLPNYFKFSLDELKDLVATPPLNFT